MAFELLSYHHPDFSSDHFVSAPDAAYAPAEKDEEYAGLYRLGRQGSQLM